MEILTISVLYYQKLIKFFVWQQTLNKCCMFSLLLLVLLDWTQGYIEDLIYKTLQLSLGQGQRNLNHVKSNSDQIVFYKIWRKTKYPWQHQMFRTRCIGLTGLHWSLTTDCLGGAPASSPTPETPNILTLPITMVRGW